MDPPCQALQYGMTTPLAVLVGGRRRAEEAWSELLAVVNQITLSPGYLPLSSSSSCSLKYAVSLFSRPFVVTYSRPSWSRSPGAICSVMG